MSKKSRKIFHGLIFSFVLIYFNILIFSLHSLLLFFIANLPIFVRSCCKSHKHFIISRNCTLSVHYYSRVISHFVAQDITGFTGRRDDEDAGTLVLQWHYDIAEPQGSRRGRMVSKDLLRALLLAGPTCFRQIRFGPLSRTSSKHLIVSFLQLVVNWFFGIFLKCHLLKTHSKISKKI